MQGMNTLLTGFLCLAAAAGPAHSQLENARPRFGLEGRALAQVAGVLRRHDMDEELGEVRAILDERGEPATGAIETAGGKLQGALAIRSAARTVRSVAAGLARELPSLPPAERHRLARVILRLDSMQRDANEALGHEWSGRRWLHVSSPAVSAAVREARTLPVPLVIEPSREPLLKGAPDVTAVRCKNVTLHTDLPRERAESLFREAFRATALGSFLRGGPLEVPETMGAHQGNAILLFQLRSYRDVFKNAKKLGWLTQREVLERIAVPASWLRGTYVAVFTREKYPAGPERPCFGAALIYLSWSWWELGSKRAVQPYLAFGLLDWICLNHHRSLLPPFKTDAAMTFTQLGVPGLRQFSAAAKFHLYVSRAVRSHEEFSYQSLLAATLGVDFLLEHGDFVRILEATRYDASVDGALAASLEKGLGRTLERFDANWRRWAMSFQPGLAQRLEDCTYP